MSDCHTAPGPAPINIRHESVGLNNTSAQSTSSLAHRQPASCPAPINIGHDSPERSNTPVDDGWFGRLLDSIAERSSTLEIPPKAVLDTSVLDFSFLTLADTQQNALDELPRFVTMQQVEHEPA